METLLLPLLAIVVGALVYAALESSESTPTSGASSLATAPSLGGAAPKPWVLVAAFAEAAREECRPAPFCIRKAMREWR